MITYEVQYLDAARKWHKVYIVAKDPAIAASWVYNDIPTAKILNVRPIPEGPIDL